MAFLRLGALALALMCTATTATTEGQICDTTVEQDSGFYNLTTGDKHYFFWFFESRSTPSTDPVCVLREGGGGDSCL